MVECQKPESILGEQSSAWLNKCKLSATTKRINVKTAVCLRQVASSESDDLEGQHKIGRSPLLMMMTALKARRRPEGENKQVYLLPVLQSAATASSTAQFFYCSLTATTMTLLWHTTTRSSKCYFRHHSSRLSITSYSHKQWHESNESCLQDSEFSGFCSHPAAVYSSLQYCSWVALLISALNLGSTSPNAIFEKSSKNILHWCRCRRTLSGHPFFQSLTFCLGKTWFLLSTFSCEWMCFITLV